MFVQSLLLSKAGRWLGITILMALPAAAIATASWFNQRLNEAALRGNCTCCGNGGPLAYEEIFVGAGLVNRQLYNAIGPFCQPCRTTQKWREHPDFTHWAEHPTRAEHTSAA